MVNEITSETNSVQDNGTRSTNQDQESKEVRKEVRSFYFVKHRPHVDPAIKSQIEEAEQIVKTMFVEQISLLRLIDKRKLERNILISRVNYGERRELGVAERYDWLNDGLNSLKLALDKLNFANKAYQDKAIKSSFLVEEVNFRNLHCRLLHGSKGLAAEKRLLKEAKERPKTANDSCSTLEDLDRDIYGKIYACGRGSFYIDEERQKQLLKEVKSLKLKRELVVANAAVKGSIWNSLGSKREMKKLIIAMEKQSEEVIKRHKEIKSEIKQAKEELQRVEKELQRVEKEIASLEEQCREAIANEGRAKNRLVELKKQAKAMNRNYNEYVRLKTRARKMAKRKDAATLESWSKAQVGDFMANWNSIEAFRKAYQKNLLPSSLGTRPLNEESSV